MDRYVIKIVFETTYIRINNAITTSIVNIAIKPEHISDILLHIGYDGKFDIPLKWEYLRLFEHESESEKRIIKSAEIAEDPGYKHNMGHEFELWIASIQEN